MKTLPTEDTIVALSSPLGSGAIAVIRVSGKDSLAVVNPCLKNPLKEKDVRRACFTELHSGNPAEVVDQVVATYFQNPASYTGEDVIEISCHCNPLIINRIINGIVQHGARIAEPGEFTFRAFMNGKMDLAQAESVAEIINARSRQSLTQSLRHLEGRLTEKILDIKNDILHYLSLIEISLDFSEEDIELIPYDELREKIKATVGKIEQLIHTYDYGRLLQEGIKMIILGKPNVGKSSLLNALLQKDRAIVSDIPGTTRDYIEANIDIDGLAVQAIDTAGIRETEDTIEAIGVERTLAQIQTADVALSVFEGQAELDEDDQVLIQLMREHADEVKFVAVLNKADQGSNGSTRRILTDLSLPAVEISALQNENIDVLKKTIKSELVSDESLEAEEVVVTSARHKLALEKTITSLLQANEAVDLQASEEIIAVDLRLALDHLGQITGETTPDDVLNHIFANFCIGK